MIFPEIGTLLRIMGAEILTYPSAFNVTTGRAHWETILRARAIENQCYVVAAAQYGKPNTKRLLYGHSVIINPWVEIIASCPIYDEKTDADGSIAVAEVDPQLIQEIRNVLITSLRVVPRLENLIQHERNDFFETVSKVQKDIEMRYATSSSTICIQDGADAGQTVAHVHCHILPRKPNDFQNNDDVYSKLAKHDRDNNVKRDIREQTKEATNLWKFF